MSIQHRTTHSGDGVRIAYSISGAASPALVFIHGGLADRTFWDGQHAPFSQRFKVIALDLAGHGESGNNRREWGMLPFAGDVTAVIEAEKAREVILVGNSLGGAVALEAAVLLAKRTLGVVGVDTFHDLTRRMEAAAMQEQAKAWAADFNGSLDNMLWSLFHSDVPPALLEDVRQRMSQTSREAVVSMFSSFAGYDTSAPAKQLRVPVWCINGDLFRTNVQANRGLGIDFDAYILPHTGHFPMLECPVQFNRTLKEVVASIIRMRS